MVMMGWVRVGVGWFWWGGVGLELGGHDGVG